MFDVLIGQFRLNETPVLQELLHVSTQTFLLLLVSFSWSNRCLLSEINVCHRVNILRSSSELTRQFDMVDLHVICQENI